MRAAFSVLPLCLIATAADAQEAALPADQFVVTATRSPVPLEEVLAPVLVIGRADIERSAAVDTSELLRFHAGLDLGRNGGPGQTTAVFIRGAESNHTLVLVDGVRINPGTIGLAALQNIAPAMIERIEVVKGPRSALYGSDAIGGVINVITRRGTADGWSAELGYGDYDTQQASLAGSLGSERARLDLGVAWLDSAGFPTRSGDDVDRGYESLNASAQARAELGPAELAVRLWRAAGTSEYSDFFLTPVDQDFATTTGALNVAWPVGTTARAQLGASRLEDRIEQNQSPDYLRTVRYSTDGQFDWQVSGRHALAAGAMFVHELASSESYGAPLRAATDSLNLYLQDQYAAGAHRALLALGYTDHETAGDALTWNAEYGYSFGDRTLLYALAGSGFRAPDATDRYGFGGNPDLEPERSRLYEVGVRQRIGERHELSLSAFRNDIDDLIEFVTLCYGPGEPVAECTGFTGENRNVDEARIDGVEIAWQYHAASWHARVEAIHQDPRNLGTGTELFRRASDSLTVAVQRSFGPVEVGLDVLATGERRDYGFPQPVTLDGYVLANLSARWQVTRSLALVGRIENLLDEQYELAHTFNTPDRGLYVAVRYVPGGRGPATVASPPPRDAAAARSAYSAARAGARREQTWVTD